MKKEKSFSKGCKIETIISQTLYTNAFELFVFDTRKNMLEGIKKWLQKGGYQNDVTQMSGVVYENEKQPVIKHNDEEYRLFAAMFLNEDEFSVDILAHECVHAAMTCERKIVRYQGLYDGNDGTGSSPEERLAYTVGDFVENVLKVCLEKKIKVKYILDYEKLCKTLQKN